MSDKAKIKRYDGLNFVEIYPLTKHDQIIASGSPGSTTFLRGDGVWATPTGGSGTVTSVGGTGTVLGISLTGTVTESGSLTLSGTPTVASTSASGIVSTSAQTLAGEKTFQNGIRSGSGTQSWQIESQAGSNLLFRSGSSPVTRMTLSTGGVLTATTFSGSGSSLTNLNATNVSSGTLPVLRLGSGGTRDAATYLNGNNEWVTTPGIFSASLATMTSNGTFSVSGVSGYRWFVVDIVAAGLRGSTLIRYVAGQSNVCLVSLAGSNRGGTIQTNATDFVLSGITGTPTINIFGVR
jgi:hypothetical protein